MQHRSARRLYITGFALAFVLAAVPARAQYQPRPLDEPATGESYHIEGAIGFWFPSSSILVASGGGGALTGIVGTQIDARTDLGLEDHRMSEMQLVLRPSKRNKFYFQYIPIHFDMSSVLKRPLVFNGQLYQLSLPVNSSLDWNAYRIGYEFDFVSRSRGYAGFMLEAKYTDTTVSLAAPGISEFASARAPVPAIGGIGRVYIVPNISVTGELSGFELPASLIKGDSGHYIDYQIYGTVNFTNNIGVQAGFRSLDVNFLVNTNYSGAFTMRGLYLGVVARY